MLSTSFVSEKPQVEVKHHSSMLSSCFGIGLSLVKHGRYAVFKIALKFTGNIPTDGIQTGYSQLSNTVSMLD